MHVARGVRIDKINDRAKGGLSFVNPDTPRCVIGQEKSENIHYLTSIPSKYIISCRDLQNINTFLPTTLK